MKTHRIHWPSAFSSSSSTVGHALRLRLSKVCQTLFVLLTLLGCLASTAHAVVDHEAFNNQAPVTEVVQGADNVTFHAAVKHHGHTLIINGTEVRCGPAAIEEFPRPMIDAEMRAKGGVVVHIITAISMVLIISVLCKEYFVPALHGIINYLEIDPDVAGGTFMAAASSIPALVTSIIGVNIVENDLGLSTTLGSGVLNAAGVLSISALFAKRSVEIHAWPLYRSSFFFLLCMVIVLFALMDNGIDWIEALICLVSYLAYALVMAFNRRLECAFKAVTGIQDLDDPVESKEVP
ncbi:sodium/potassium/calcium exchanger 4-like, partial [Tropilaelaps mercedesae]